MGLFLPILLLGLAQPVEQPAISPAQPQSQEPAKSSALVNPRFTLSQTSQFAPLDKQATTSEENRKVCFTMRSYIFERRDELAPELVGMTTCDPAKASGARRVRSRARLVPAN